MNILGLIGRNISYSFSQNYFQEKFKALQITDFQYELFDISTIEGFVKIANREGIRGCNVTIPYKELIIPFLDELSDDAAKIGAVNTVLFQNGRKIGYNTDAFGFKKSLLTLLKPMHQSAIILGDGGASKAVQYVLEDLAIPFVVFSRKGTNRLDTLDSAFVNAHKLIVQTTPVGTFPRVDDCLRFPFDGLSSEHLVMDLIYNPTETQFMKNANERGAITLNGLAMLQNQADKAWEIWSNLS